jgi:hypothetical protein
LSLRNSIFASKQHSTMTEKGEKGEKVTSGARASGLVTALEAGLTQKRHRFPSGLQGAAAESAAGNIQGAAAEQQQQKQKQGSGQARDVMQNHVSKGGEC